MYKRREHVIREEIIRDEAIRETKRLYEKRRDNEIDYTWIRFLYEWIWAVQPSQLCLVTSRSFLFCRDEFVASATWHYFWFHHIRPGAWLDVLFQEGRSVMFLDQLLLLAFLHLHSQRFSKLLHQLYSLHLRFSASVNNSLFYVDKWVWDEVLG